jgi:hypothetical protein
MNDVLTQISMVLDCPTKENISSLFEESSFIRLNMLYISPITLMRLRKKLIKMGLLSWEINNNGMSFIFHSLSVHFRGNYKIYKRQKIFAIELDFEPLVNGAEGYDILYEIEA